MIVYQSPVNTIHRADARQVAAEQQAGSFALAVLDGPYGMDQAAWDRMTVADLPEWYAPHLDDLGRLCAEAASLYVWNTAQGWALLHAAIIARGWRFRSLVTWDKGVAFMAGRCDVRGLRSWYDVTEVCGLYQREPFAASSSAGQVIAYAAGADDRNTIRPWIAAEWKAAGLRQKQADEACGVSRMASRHYFPADQWALPTWEAFQALAAYADRHGRPRAWPYLVKPEHVGRGGLRATWESISDQYRTLIAEYEHLAAEYEARRPVFSSPVGVSNVWRHPTVGGRERLRGADGATLHPCQKPIRFADRIIRASSRPGERVWVPFGGTCREAVAAEWIARAEPDEARQVVTCEIDEDGRDYLGAVVQQLRGEDVRPRDPRQASLFGGQS